MLTQVDKHSGVPAYFQIMNVIKKEILLGNLIVGDQLPPVREMASIFGVNMNTVMRALEKLSFENVVQAEHGVGYFIKEGLNINQDVLDLLKKTINELKTRNIDLQMSLILIEELWKY